jgi:glutaredoxin
MVDNCCVALLKNVKNRQSPVIFIGKQEDGCMSDLYKSTLDLTDSVT